jgi:outer membrane protein assembly factor BamA
MFCAVFLSAGFLYAQCANDYRSNKNAGILITDFPITGAQTISATELARITSDLIGSCFDEDSEELEERIRASFQDRGYFAAKVNRLGFKPSDPLAVPKPVTLEADISDGPRYKLGEITFVENHAFSSEKLREQFALKRGDLFERGKVASGLKSLRKLYGTQGFLDFTAIPDTKFASNGTANLNMSIQEGTQYHMGKLDIVADKEVAARLRPEWKQAEGDVYDQTYINQYLEANRDLLPVGFSRANVHGIQNCPDAVVEVRLIIDPDEDTSHAEPKNVPCEEHHDVSK